MGGIRTTRVHYICTDSIFSSLEQEYKAFRIFVASLTEYTLYPTRKFTPTIHYTLKNHYFQVLLNNISTYVLSFRRNILLWTITYFSTLRLLLITIGSYATTCSENMHEIYDLQGKKTFNKHCLASNQGCKLA